MKGLIVQQQPAQPVMEENMSNLTSASNEASVSSVNRNDNGSGGSIYPPQQYFAPQNQTQVAQPQQAVKKKRNLPGNPGASSLNEKKTRLLLVVIHQR